MTQIESFQEHLQRISICAMTDLDTEVSKFIRDPANKDLGDKELFDKIYAVYGTRIKAVENTANTKLMSRIRGWLIVYGVIFVVTLILFIIWFLYALIK